jgi:predicted ABC-type ATPase
VARQFWLVAGVNGAGKSTHGAAVVGGAIMNPDIEAKQIHAWLAAHQLGRPLSLSRLLANWIAVEKIESDVASAIRNGRDVAVETVLSTDKYRRHLEAARGYGYKVSMVYVALSSAELAVRRVRARVLANGHNVPEEKIRARWKRSMEQLVNFVPLLDELLVIDNSEETPVLLAEKAAGSLVILDRVRIPDLTLRLECAAKT